MARILFLLLIVTAQPGCRACHSRMLSAGIQMPYQRNLPTVILDARLKHSGMMAE
jgi:hypothetical protein